MNFVKSIIQLVLLLAAATQSYANGNIARRCGPASYTVAEAIETEMTGGAQDNCDPSPADRQAFCQARGSEFPGQCMLILGTERGPYVRSDENCPQVQALDRRNRETVQSLRQNINAFYGDELPGSIEAGSDLSNRYFLRCPSLPNTAGGVVARDTVTPGTATCAAMANLECEGNVLNGFHFIRIPGEPTRYRLYTAAHVLNGYNRQLNPGSGRSEIYQFENCTVRFANGGPALTGLTIGRPQFKNAVVREAIENRNTPSFSAVDSLRRNDIAWFEINPSGNESVLNNTALTPFPGSTAQLAGARVCSAGNFGLSATVQRCTSHGGQIGADGRFETRTPTVRGMSGGVFSATISGRTYAVGVISSEWTADTSVPNQSDQIPGTGGSHVLEFTQERANRGIRY